MYIHIMKCTYTTICIYHYIHSFIHAYIHVSKIMGMLASSSIAIAIAAISISITPSFFSHRPSSLQKKIRTTLSKIPASSASASSSSSSSLSNSSSDTPELQYAGDLPKKGSRKRCQIAGVDQDELLDPWLLADADSRFAELHGVQIHYKIARPNASYGERTEEESKVPEEEVEDGKFNVIEGKEEETLCEEKQNVALPAVILLHGFGGSLFSFERVLKPLSSIFRSPVLAFDRPGFGLTSRVKLPSESVWPSNIMSSDSDDMVSSLPINPYSIGFSSSATMAFMDFLQSKEAVLIG